MLSKYRGSAFKTPGTSFHTNTCYEMDYLIKSNKGLRTPHVAGWTNESELKLAQLIVAQIKEIYKTSFFFLFYAII